MKKIKIFAILNITPDSFSDGNLFNTKENAHNQLEHLIKQGADVIDIGAISTRPNTQLPSVEEEILRYEQVLDGISPIINNSNVEISIDSFNYETIEYLDKRIRFEYVNDQSGLADERVIQFVKENNKQIIIMHNLGLPSNPRILVPEDENILEIVKNWFNEKIAILTSYGIAREKIILDPGIGFGKSASQSWEMIKHAQEFQTLGCKIMFGYSRKSFLNKVSSKAFSERDPETAIISSFLASKEIDFIRVHNVELNKQAIEIAKILFSPSPSSSQDS